MHDIRSLVREVPDYPKPGVLFYDITPVLGDGPAFGELLSRMVEPHRDSGITKVAGIEARGFTLAAPVAQMLGAGFIPVRKPGKLPHDTFAESFALEYGEDSLEVHIDAAHAGDKVLIVDDVIATGGTAAAAVELFSKLGAEVSGLSVFIELTFLNGRDRLGDLPLHALLEY